MKLTVVKIGGNVIDNPTLCSQFLSDFAQIAGPKILVHGGGKIATQIAEKLGIETVMVEGRRITDQSMLNVVTMVYGGLVNKNLVAQLQKFGTNAIGLTGADGGVILSKKRPVKEIDYGFVGDIERVDAGQIAGMISQGLTPVFAPLTYDLDGNMLNTNADTQAQAVATAMAKEFEVNLVYCFEKKGVLSNPDDDDSVIPQLQPEAYSSYKATGAINKGMIPKLDNAFKALDEGVKQVTICHAKEVLAAVTDGNAGTKLTI
ncbi:acetylglutamate kinase [Flectobacillus rivi]|uniref:Acetylglutamate kinase n=1 Tax=Flectobacillus rivi TaxID=2984209 RepID=A0ABT6YXH9_9BACT|nr:acetylglutamate kinase [Flectobacillus rivi]MDI9873582.1 acetylglutamate kinase [Flectobacillus rivi]